MRAFKKTDRSELNSAKYWLRMAKRAREDAERASKGKIRHMMLGFADGYEKMARRVDRIAEQAKR